MLSENGVSAIRRSVRRMREGHVEHGNALIHYVTAGDGPAVLFLHAGVADSRMWRHQIGADGFQAIAFDQRGFGRTPWASEPFANRDDALAVLDHLLVDSAVVVGCSNGGEAALQLAIASPHRVSGLVLVGAAARGWEPAAGWQDEPGWDETVAAFDAGDYDTVVDLEAQLWLAGPDRSLDDVDAELLELFREMDRIPQSSERDRNLHVRTADAPTNDRLDEIDVPTLVVVGEHDLPDLHESAVYLAGRLSSRPALVLKGTAHLPSLERPEAFNAALTDFVLSI